jgi:hypothetical protein
LSAPDLERLRHRLTPPTSRWFDGSVTG